MLRNIVVLGVNAASQQTLFYCLRLAIHLMLERGDQNAMLGVMKVLRILLLRSKLFYCLRLPIHPLLEGGEPNDILGVTKVLGVSAASQQTLFIVSGSPSNPILGEVN